VCGVNAVKGCGRRPGGHAAAGVAVKGGSRVLGKMKVGQAGVNGVGKVGSAAAPAAGAVRGQRQEGAYQRQRRVAAAKVFQPCSCAKGVAEGRHE